MTVSTNRSSPSCELIPVVDVEAERTAEIIRHHFDIHLVFNGHGTTEDAQNILAEIDNNSIVFIESCETAEPDETPDDLHAALTQFGLDRMHRPLTAIEQARYTAAIKNESDLCTQEDSRPTDFVDFDTTISDGLINKNCGIFVADAIFAHDSQEARLVKEYLDSKDEWVNDVDFGTGLRNMQQHIRNEVAFCGVQNIREQMAYARLADILPLIRSMEIDSGLDSSLVRSVDGRLKVFVVYGTAHHHTLQSRFTERSIPVTVHALEILPDDGYEQPYINPNHQQVITTNQMRAHYITCVIEAYGISVGIFKPSDVEVDNLSDGFRAAYYQLSRDDQLYALSMANSAMKACIETVVAARPSAMHEARIVRNLLQHVTPGMTDMPDAPSAISID